MKQIVRSSGIRSPAGEGTWGTSSFTAKAHTYWTIAVFASGGP
jgi:hypothetical protein